MSGFGDSVAEAKLPAGHRAVLDTWSESYSERFPETGETAIYAYLYEPSMDPENAEPASARYFGMYPRGEVDWDHVNKRWKDTLEQWRVRAHKRKGTRGVRAYWKAHRAEQARLRRGADRLGRQVEREMSREPHAELTDSERARARAHLPIFEGR
jgi:hypothetical protein